MRARLYNDLNTLRMVGSFPFCLLDLHHILAALDILTQTPDRDQPRVRSGEEGVEPSRDVTDVPLWRMIHHSPWGPVATVWGLQGQGGLGRS